MSPEENAQDAQDEVDYDFILAELERVNTAAPEEVLAHYRANPTDGLYSFHTPSGQLVNFTRAGYHRLLQIVERRLGASAVLRHRFTNESLVKHLRTGVFARASDGSLARTDPATLFNAAMASAQETHREITHFIPCAVAAHATPPRFSIGPVIFHRQELFWCAAEPQIRKQITGSQEIAESFLSDLKSFYGSYWWVAEIRVPLCDPKLSWVRATRIVQKCLDLLKLRMGSARAARIHQAYDTATPHDVSHLRKIGDDFDFSVGGAKMHDAVLNDDWFGQITADPTWKIAESLIQAYWDGWEQAPSELRQRFLDAMSWHSDAVSESDVTAQIVKYWTAIERVATLRRDDNVKKNAAILLSDTAEEFAAASEKTLRLYRCRNSIVHGSARRGDEELIQCARESEDVSQRTIFSYLWLIRGAPANIAPDRALKIVRDLFRQWEDHLKTNAEPRHKVSEP